MCPRKRHARQHIEAPVAIDLQAGIGTWMSAGDAACRVCGETPCLTGVCDGRVVHETHLCGACTWGEADCIDPANW